MQTKSQEMEIYELLNNTKGKYGKYNKCLFHLHTPASYDYCLYEENRAKADDDDNSYKNLKDIDLYNFALQEKLFIEQIKLENIKYNNKIFSNLKEYISYLLIVHKIILNDISTVVVSDHNTIEGYKKLVEAIKDYTKNKVYRIYPEIILGVEISCADLNHVVSIFHQDKYDEVNVFLQDYIMEKKKGTYLSSIDVIEKIDNIGGVTYLAHINTSNIFKKDFLSDGYKEKLFSLPELNLIGISRVEEKENIERLLKNYSNKKFGFILDSDSHSIDTIDKKLFWVKGTKTDYRMIKDIIRDYDVTVSLKEPVEPQNFIKGIVIENDDDNFLISKDYLKNNNKYLVINFSTSLNCIIGGRGSGKSTILNILQFILGLKVKNDNNLEMICKHKNIWIIYKYGKRDYIIKLMPPKKEYNDDNIIKCFEDIPYRGDYYNRKYHWDEEKIKRYTLRHYMKLYYVQNNNKQIIEYKSAKMPLLEKFFKAGYSVNDLVNIAGSDEINNYIPRIIFQNSKLDYHFKLTAAHSIKKLKENIKLVYENKQKREQQVNSILKQYNELNNKKMKIVYNQKETQVISDIVKNNGIIEKFIGRTGKKYNILLTSIDDYFNVLISKIGILNIIELIVNKESNEIENKLKLEDFAEELTQKDIEHGWEDINNDNAKMVIDDIIQNIIDDGIPKLNNILNDYLNNMERFNIEFNVNSNKKNQPIIYREVSKLSLGQKVVAMLTFILSYSELAEDYTPLIIDQPEDNLDSQYIYNNLVNELRKAKEKRQVIIATHNSTIVTNAKTDNVIIMKSDNEKGWVEKSGYPTETSILNGILNYLEGGKDSFNHKKSLYEDVL